MARSYVRIDPYAKYVGFQFSCSCGATSLPRKTDAAAERDRKAHMARAHRPLFPDRIRF
ncbi:hypothetical protein [Streptomyces sp. NBC_01237]|uniref:hypothetical protein n=1 Tax=Streptomyces sp. NBC_01237 TaxID=2903790 RepID=UPI002DD9CF9D|nr:hypothetical protein [Streptomyces sp. NBC_01237]WRZ73905.1 hypothetical protein OG251_20985 [Streptomyces sp. NBC_01237]